MSAFLPYSIPLLILCALKIQFRGSMILFACLLAVPAFFLLKMTWTLGIEVWNSGTILLLGMAILFTFRRHVNPTQNGTEPLR